MANWIREFPRDKCQTFFCSECGRRVYYIDGQSRGRCPKVSRCRYKYCPWCKAEMYIENQCVARTVIEKENASD